MGPSSDPKEVTLVNQHSTMERPRAAVQGETWNDHWLRKMAQYPPGATSTPPRGDATKPAQPDGTTPLERDEGPINQSR